MQHATVLLALFLFAWAATASAECAWVLWKGQSQSDGNWIRLDVFDARPACLRVLDRYQGVGAQLTHRMSETHLAVTVPGTAVTEYICLPDALNPREPMAK
jgi:hypothetical protein